MPGVRGESFPGPSHSSPRGCCKHYHSQVWPGKLLGRANVGSSWAPRGRAGSWRQDSPSPTLRRPHPQDRTQKRVRLWGGFSHTHLPFIQEPALSIHYDLQEASRPLAAPRPPPGKTKPRHQLPEGFRKFWAAEGAAPGSWPKNPIGAPWFVHPTGQLAPQGTQAGPPPHWAGHESSAGTARRGPKVGGVPAKAGMGILVAMWRGHLEQV